MTNLDPASLAESLGTLVRREASTAMVNVDEDEDGYWCVSWRIEGNADRELFVEFPGSKIAPDVLRVGIYFRDATGATATADAHRVALEALTTRSDALASLGVICTFTPGDSTRDDQTFAWGQPDLEQWLAESSANRDLVWRYHLRPGPPPVAQLESVVQHLVPVWRAWNQL